MSELRAPFPWFGGKSRAAAEIWAALGDVKNYVEPFAGSLAVLLGRPGGAGPIETVNDTDGHLVNVWRSIRSAPDEVARWADWPVSEIDLTARHAWLVERRADITARLTADPDWCDPKAAGWWVWGACSWIGSGWCSGDGPWSVVDGVMANDAGRGINRQLPHLGNAGRGINRKLPHLGNAGQGINRQLPHLGNAGQGINRRAAGAEAWFAALSDRLRGVRITAGDWSRVCTPSATHRHGLTGVVLDPPYPEGWDADRAYSGQDGSDVQRLWADVTAWAAEAGEREDMRIVVCGYEGTWDPPAGWSARRWRPRKGYAVGDDSRRERLWCSPHCQGAGQVGIFDGAP